MLLFKCKMCGGDVEPAIVPTTGQANGAYGTCGHCGTTMTLPRASDEQKVNLFNRANHFRRRGDFDQAVRAFEGILDMDASDAEAHWGLVLSRYGIEYVEDPATHKQVPTCHRVQIDPILADPDYLAALEHAPDGYTRGLYEEEAKTIAEIQKGILAISAKEKPYDVFICYKETTDGGTRTKDSALAQDVYYQLENEGYKVFFSRITLEDKLGREYEPYIFAALNSARVMLAIGTAPEHYSAPWVKNEWGRFLALMRKDRSRLLIPCYRDMDAYDLPSELSVLQSQDMSKIGFVQDLIRGIKKVLPAGSGRAGQGQAQTPTAVPITAIPQGAPPVSPTTDALLRRSSLLMEDGDWEKADALLEQVLNIDPENARAYIGKLLVKLKLASESMLPEALSQNGVNSLTEHKDFEKALRFADEDYRNILMAYETEYKQNNIIFQEALAEIDRVETEEELDTLSTKFNSINDFRISEILQHQCQEKLKLSGWLTKEDKYNQALSNMNTAFDVITWENAARLFETLSGYRDADKHASFCQTKADECAIEDKKRDRSFKIFINSFCVLILILLIIIILQLV